MTVVKLQSMFTPIHRDRACRHDMHDVYTMYTGPRRSWNSSQQKTILKLSLNHMFD